MTIPTIIYLWFVKISLENLRLYCEIVLHVGNLVFKKILYYFMAKFGYSYNYQTVHHSLCNYEHFFYVPKTQDVLW